MQIPSPREQMLLFKGKEELFLKNRESLQGNKRAYERRWFSTFFGRGPVAKNRNKKNVLMSSTVCAGLDGSSKRERKTK
jgi:hypothetical protein